MSNAEQTPIEKIKDRIAKLLRMSKDSSSPEEAAIAAGRARSLMDKHQLSEFDVGDCVKDVFAAERITPLYKVIPKYMSILSVSVAKYNDCQAAYDGEYVTRGSGSMASDYKQAILFKGYKNDVDLGGMMFDRLCKIMQSLATKHVKQLIEDGDLPKNCTMSDPDAIRISALFKAGVVDELCRRLRDMTVERDALTSSSAGTSLVIVKSKAVAERFGKPQYSKISQRRLSNAEQHARACGQIEGRKVTIVAAVR